VQAAQAAPTPAALPSSLAVQFKQPLHAVVTVEVNDKGQVSKVRSIKPSASEAWNINVYANAQQMFIRKPDGTAVAGVYDVTYDYSPSVPRDRAVTRHVELVHPGGVDGSAPGLVDRLRGSPSPGK
jgi:Neuraminidase (sialidase)